MALDPIHIGTGRYRLGRVDAAIACEPGLKLPKIPGTSLHGAARYYAAYRADAWLSGLVIDHGELGQNDGFIEDRLVLIKKEFFSRSYYTRDGINVHQPGFCGSEPIFAVLFDLLNTVLV
jgi:CRISPR/Cas system CMR subunit Cmr4 (Cas7 group RAMP superfamily)